MKILLVFTLWLISGPVSCPDVIGYSGGSIILRWKQLLYKVQNKYFCKVNSRQCVGAVILNKWGDEERVYLSDSNKDLIVVYRNLRVQDAGVYKGGETGVWSQNINLTVNTDSCCVRSKTITGYLGETVTISCSYPEEFKSNIKTFCKQDGRYFTVVYHPAILQTDRFSIFDNKESKYVNVRMRDVREEDGGVYYCGVWIDGPSISYHSLYTEIELQVSDSTYKTSPTAPAAVPSEEGLFGETYRTTSARPPSGTCDGTHSGSSVIITVCVCVVLLLVGGSALIFYKLRCTKREESSPIRKRPDTNNTADGDNQDDPTGNLNNMSMSSVYQNVKPNTNQ